MPLYVESSRSASRRFITTPYRADEDGVLQPALPSCCPDHVPGGDDCALVRSHVRARKTGPCFPLTVLWCRTHRRGFTLYPLGHVPYGRQRVAPVGLDGRAAGGGDGGLEWQGTLFGAALDAAAGRAWDRAREGGSRWWWSTQGRLLSRCLDLVGVASQQSLALRHKVAEALAVATLVLVEGVAAITADPGYRSRGKAVVAVLSEISRHGVLERVLRAGQLVGRWGLALRWEPALRVLRPLAFSGSGTDPPG